MGNSQKRLFGTSGIRGDTLREITPQLALSLGLGFGEWLNRNGYFQGKVLVGHDPRYGSRILAQSAACGLASIGHDAYNVGIAPTGQFAFTVSNLDFVGGILITGSHMPYRRNGMIVLMEDGSYASTDITDEVESYMKDQTQVKFPDIEIVGELKDQPDTFMKYMSFLFSIVDAALIAKRKFKVLIDPANGAACKVVREIFERLQMDISMINHNFSPKPNRESEPLPETVEESINIVKVVGHDLGVCFDMDADRVLFIDEKGSVIPPDTMGAVFALNALEEEDVCIVPVNSSSLIDDISSRAGFALRYCKIGQPETTKAIKEYRAKFSYEESGKYYFCDNCLWSDGILSALKLMEILATENKTLMELVEKIPKYHQMKTSIVVNNLDQPAIYKKIEQKVAQDIKIDVKKKLDMDGIKFIFDNDTSIMFRFSGTEPLLRLYCDGKDLQEVKLLYEKGQKILQMIK